MYTQLVEAIYWAGKIVPDFDPRPNALYEAGYVNFLSTAMILTAYRYSMV
jgi:hypothetical protein